MSLNSSSKLSIDRPTADEFSPFYEPYIGRVPQVVDFSRQLRQQQSGVEALCASLDERQLDYRYSAGKWSVKEVVGHLGDAELVFAYRFLRITRGDETPLAGFDEQEYVNAAHFAHQSIGELAQRFTLSREIAIALARDIQPRDLERRTLVSNRALTARALAHIILGHVAHHGHVLEERYGIPGAISHTRAVE